MGNTALSAREYANTIMEQAHRREGDPYALLLGVASILSDLLEALESKGPMIRQPEDEQPPHPAARLEWVW